MAKKTRKYTKRHLTLDFDHTVKVYTEAIGTSNAKDKEIEQALKSIAKNKKLKLETMSQLTEEVIKKVQPKNVAELFLVGYNIGYFQGKMRGELTGKLITSALSALVS
jgi:hypothetical protein